MSDDLYPKFYGSWAGNPAGRKPDYSKCCESVHSREVWSPPYQCRRPRGHGPDKAYCKQHDPAAVAARGKAAQARYDAQWKVRRIEYSGKIFFNALVKIAEGHNDAMGFAREVISKFEAGE